MIRFECYVHVVAHRFIQAAQKMHLLELLHRRPIWSSPPPILPISGGNGGVGVGGGGVSFKDDKPFICPSCGKGYKWEQTLSRHLRFECGKEAMFCCPFCPQKCKQKGNLLAHIRNRHGPKTPGLSPSPS